MKRFAGVLLAAVLLTLPVRALEPEIQPVTEGGYTYYAIDADGKLYAWGDSFHGEVGPTDQDPLPREEANLLMENARYVAAGFVMAAAIDTDGVLWGWGGHAGRTFGEGEPYRLLEDVAEVSVGDTRCTALCTDGTVWVWGARFGESMEAHRDDPFFRPVQVLDHVAQLEGDMAVLEDGTLIHFGFDGDTLSTRPLMEHVADVRSWSGFGDRAYLLVQGEDGSLWRVPRVTAEAGYFLGQPEKFLEQVDWFTPSLAVTADGTLWAWGQFRPAILREGKVDSSDPLVRTSALETECENEVVKITEGVAIAAACSDRVMAVMEDGSCWQLPLAYRLLDWQENQDQTPNRPEKILDQALLPNDPPAWAAEAPAPTVLESASLAALEDAESAAPQTEQTEASPEPVPDTAPESPLAGAWLPATAAAALAVIAWLRGRKH